MDGAAADRTLHEVGRLRRDARRALNPIWFANLVAGAVFVGAAGVGQAGSAGLALAYGVVAVPGGLALIVAHAVRRERASGLEGRAMDRLGAIALALVAALVAVSVTMDGTSADAARFLVGAAGTLAIAAVLRDPVEGALSAAIAAIAVAVVVAAPSSISPWGGLALGVAMVVAGIAGRRRERAAGRG